MERVKLMITYGGKIQPRLTALHDHRRYSYIGGDNKIIIVDRNINFFDLMAKLSTFMFSDVCFKYQLLGEDFDTFSLFSTHNTNLQLEELTV
ncbi:octicosapeptide/phox/Bem1p (PB1) domain protein [Medicago truncatula]|uniref:Octicosapeptide/phox/Bem1p (PB1) domain protein n=1 Tax=Medicago truncatula TaxID=3880 RepID=G7K314_MEDTR|nr:octicosapeptide/phox/Bem1p (PB1) domain protein [Medicago truncatula]